MKPRAFYVAVFSLLSFVAVPAWYLLYPGFLQLLTIVINTFGISQSDFWYYAGYAMSLTIVLTWAIRSLEFRSAFVLFRDSGLRENLMINAILHAIFYPFIRAFVYSQDRVFEWLAYLSNITFGFVGFIQNALPLDTVVPVLITVFVTFVIRWLVDSLRRSDEATVQMA